MLDDVPLEIDIAVDRHQHQSREIPQQPETSTNENSDSTAIERYEPKGSKF